MSLADNIIKYRQKNQLSQEQLASSLNIARQSVSKWENGDSLPSIDNLISLSGLLDISLDELITGEPYLHFPFDYGRPKNKWPVMLLVLIIVLGGLAGMIFHNIWSVILFVLASYILVILFYPIDFKRYYTYWSLDKLGIRYVVDNKEVYNSFEEIIIPLKALFHLRKTNFITYKQIEKMELKLDLFATNPNKVNAPRGGYAPTEGQYMHEAFYFVITTKDNQKIYLDLRQYYWPRSIERQMLSTIILFLKRKEFEFVDKQDISELVKDRKINLTIKLYEERDNRNKLI